MSMTLSTTWVRRGVAAQFPQKYEVDELELSRIEKLARLQLEDAQDGLNRAQHKGGRSDDAGEEEDDEDIEEDSKESGRSDREVARSAAAQTMRNGVSKSSNQDDDEDDDNDDDLKEYNLSDYDENEIDEEGEKVTMFGNSRSLAYHQPGEEDPYLVLPEGEQDSDDEREELEILPTDNLVLAAKVEDEVAHLEVLVYEDDSDNLYVHHDIMLPAVPLCVEWIDVPVGKDAGKRPNGNFAAIGTMSPEIEVWDLDVVDGMYPATILGQQPEDAETMTTTTEGSNGSKKKKTKKKKMKPKANDKYHVDAVLALAANRQHRNLLASASADSTVKLWDLTTGTCAQSYTMHSGKVCALDWHPKESTILLSGSYDRTVVASDMRAPDAVAPKWVVEADVEKVRWDFHDPNFFYVTTEAGTIHLFDVRNPPASHTAPSKPVWTLQAHDGAISAFDINPVVPGFLVTGSDDKRVKLWNVQDNKPGMVVSRNLDVGRVFAAQFAPDQEVAFRLSIAGSRGQVQIWDTSTNAAVRNVFAGRVKLPEGDVKERIVGLRKDDDDESESGEDEDGGADAGGGDGWESMEEN